MAYIKRLSIKRLGNGSIMSSDLFDYREPTAEVSAAFCRANLAEILGAAHFRSRSTVITHHGKPYAQIIHPDDADALKLFRALGQRAKEQDERLKGFDDLRVGGAILLAKERGPEIAREFLLTGQVSHPSSSTSLSPA